MPKRRFPLFGKEGRGEIFLKGPLTYELSINPEFTHFRVYPSEYPPFGVFTRNLKGRIVLVNAGERSDMDSEQRRATRRVPFKRPVLFKVMGNTTHPTDTVANEGEILDVSDTGMKIREKGRSLQDGFVVVVRFPLSETQTTVPAMAQVKWVRPERPGVYEAGLMFMV